MKIDNQKDYTIRNIIGSFLPLIVAVLLQYIVNIFDVLFLFLHNVGSEKKSGAVVTVEDIMNQSYNQPMNLAYMTLAQHLLYLLCFGLWYYKVFYKTKDESARGLVPCKRILLSFSTLCFAIAGFASQAVVDGILTFVRPLFEQAFSDYDKLVSRVIGVYSSPIMIIAVIFVAPIGEELLFRGVIQSYSQRYMPAIMAILFQGVLFGLYHGNTIQGIYAFVLGSLIGWIAYHTKSLIPGMVFHLILNASMFIVPDTWFETTTKCSIATILGLIISCVAILAAKKLQKRKHLQQA